MSSRLPALAACLVATAALTGCLTPRVKPTPSPAVLQARAGVGAKPAACTGEKLEAVSPVNVGFAFDDPQITPAGQSRIAEAARWLACNAGVEVVIKPDADHHGDAAHMNALAQQRAQAVQTQLRAAGATAATIRILPRDGADPVTGPHMLIVAEGRGW